MTITDPTVATKRLRASFPVVEFKAGTNAAGKRTFSALVAVFGNVDLHGDRIVPGAFDKSLAAWRERGDPIPVIWSHNWADPHAFVGQIDPRDAKATDRGLEVTGTLDDDPSAAKVHELLRSRRVTQWSFAYDVFGEKTAGDGANELLELGLIETGPTLKGANPITDTIGVKADGATVTIPRDLAEAILPAEITRTWTAASTNGKTETVVVEPGPDHHKGGSGRATDETTWDGNAAMTAVDTAAGYRAICAGERTEGEPDERAHWALPHHKSPGSPANAAGVRAARARFSQTEGLADREAVRRHLFETHLLPGEGEASVDPAAVKAEAIERLTAMRDWATTQLESLDPTIDAGESKDLDLAAQLEKARVDLGL